MKAESEFEIRLDGSSIKINRVNPRAERILQIAKDRDLISGSPIDYNLKSKNRLYKPDDEVDIKKDQDFQLIEMNTEEPKSVFEIEVNGIKIKVNKEKLQAEQILQIAKEKEAMPGKPGDYDLQGEERLYKPEDWVNVKEDKTVHYNPQRTN